MNASHPQMNLILVTCGILILLFAGSGCKPRTDISAIARPVHLDPFMKTKLEKEILEHRRRRDDYFRTASDSPLPPEIKAAFRELSYYPLNWKYRFEGPVLRYPEPAAFKIITTSGISRDAIKYGYIRFQMERQEFKLEVYQLLDLEQKNLLFLPFVDANSGKETYPAGRYIDLEEKANGVYVIDFNTAYNPSCAYGGDFPCPVTPDENHLSIPVPAGEKLLPIAAGLKGGSGHPPASM